MRKELIHATIAGLFVLLSVAALADPSSKKYALNYGKQYDLCRALEPILNLPDNTSQRLGGYNDLYIPETAHDFRLPMWKSATIGEFRLALPDRSNRLSSYYGEEAFHEASVRKTRIDIFHTGQPSDIFEITIGSTIRRFAVLDWWEGGRRWFDDNIAFRTLLFYRGRLYSIKGSSKGRLLVREPGTGASGPEATVCIYSIN